MKTRSIFFAILLFFPFYLISYEYELSILAIFRDEAPYLKEWIDYHQRLGVEHFLLYNHLSIDEYQDELAPYIKSGVVELYDWKDPAYPKAQVDAYREGIGKMKKRTKWLALIDIDEFLVPHHEKNLQNLLKEYEPYAGLVVNWQLFGTSNIETLERGEWITRHLTWKFPKEFNDPTWNSNFFVKSIIRPDRIDENGTHPQCGAHVFLPKKKYTLVNTDKTAISPACKVNKIVIDRLQLNHYWFRTLDWFYKVKVGRRTGVGDKYSPEKIEYLLKMGHTEEDLAIQELLPDE